MTGRHGPIVELALATMPELHRCWHPTPPSGIDKMNTKEEGQMKTQAERLFDHLRIRPHTTMEMLALGISVSPWRRIAEGARRLQDGERVVKGERDGLVTYAVKRG